MTTLLITLPIDVAPEEASINFTATDSKILPYISKQLYSPADPGYIMYLDALAANKDSDKDNVASIEIPIALETLMLISAGVIPLVIDEMDSKDITLLSLAGVERYLDPAFGNFMDISHRSLLTRLP